MQRHTYMMQGSIPLVSIVGIQYFPRACRGIRYSLGIMFWGDTVFKGLPDSLWHRENTITLPGTVHYACCSLSSHLMWYLRGWLDGLNSVRSHLPYHCLLPVHLSRQMVSKHYWVFVFPLYCALSVVWFTWYFICPPPPPTPVPAGKEKDEATEGTGKDTTVLS